VCGHDSIARILLNAALKLHQNGEWQPKHLASENDQPDLLLELGGEEIIADVTIINPIAPSHVDSSAWQQHAALYDAEENKKKKYHHIGKHINARVVGLAFDVFGAMGEGAKELLDRLCLISLETPLVSPADFTRDLFDSIAITLARRVGALVKEGRDRLIRQSMTSPISKPTSIRLVDTSRTISTIPTSNRNAPVDHNDSHNRGRVTNLILEPEGEDWNGGLDGNSREEELIEDDDRRETAIAGEDTTITTRDESAELGTEPNMSSPQS
jgi:hypothetical protein